MKVLRFGSEGPIVDFLQNILKIQGKVKAIRQFNLGTDPSESNYFIMEDGSVYEMDGYVEESTAKEILDSSKKTTTTDIIENKETSFIYLKYNL